MIMSHHLAAVSVSELTGHVTRCCLGAFGSDSISTTKDETNNFNVVQHPQHPRRLFISV